MCLTLAKSEGMLSLIRNLYLPRGELVAPTKPYDKPGVDSFDWVDRLAVPRRDKELPTILANRGQLATQLARHPDHMHWYVEAMLRRSGHSSTKDGLMLLLKRDTFGLGEDAARVFVDRFQ